MCNKELINTALVMISEVMVEWGQDPHKYSDPMPAGAAWSVFRRRLQVEGAPIPTEVRESYDSMVSEEKWLYSDAAAKVAHDLWPYEESVEGGSVEGARKAGRELAQRVISVLRTQQPLKPWDSDD